ncbi:MAG: DUF429 domain-containing protein [Pseudomonadota bacterium]
MKIAGIDGCKAGWFVVCQQGSRYRSFVASDFGEAARKLGDFDTIGIDIPVGIPDLGDRECEKLARRILSPRRTASVFSAPIRPLLGIEDYSEACELRFLLENKRMSKQSFFIMHKIADVDRILRSQPDFGERLHEVHPEVSFAALSGAPMTHSKRSADGFDERLAELAAVYPGDALDEALGSYPRGAVARDDVLDAFAVLWSATRIARGAATRLPDTPVYDNCGIDMAIWF